MADAEEHHLIQSKHKAINALLPYAVLQEFGGKTGILDAFLHVARASKMPKFEWHHAREYASTMFSKASLHTIILVSPHIYWGLLTERRDLVQQWAAAISAVPYTEEVAQSVVGTLLQIAYYSQLLPHIPTDIWSWLNKRPSLPPTCEGRYYGTRLPVAKAVLELKDIEILKSYFLLVWSEWDHIKDSVFDESCASIHEHFNEPWGGWHREELIQHLDHILTQLDQGLEHLQQHNPNLEEYHFQRMKDQYRKLKDTLLEVVTGVSCLIIILHCILTQWTCAGSHTRFMCALPPPCP